jgi:hypothetical protein
MAQQEAAREAAGELWQEHDVVFARQDGRPLDPRADYEEFKELLKEAGTGSRTAACTTGAATPQARS